MSNTTKVRPKKRTLSAAALQRKDEEREQRIATLMSTLETAVATLATDEGWLNYLATAARFGANWSANNTMLIMIQAAERGFTPTVVRRAEAWKKLGYSPKAGEKALWIWEPRHRRLTAEEAEKLGPAGYDNNGKPKFVPTRPFPSPRFDISQTTAPANAVTGATLLTGDDPTQAWDAIAAQIHAAGYVIERGACGGANGYTDAAAKVVRVRADVDDAQAVKTLTHELAHIALDHVADYQEYLRHRGLMETEAESVAYIVLGALGLDTSAYSVPYVAGWSSGKPELLAETAARVTRMADQILRAVEQAQEAPSMAEPVAA